MGIKVTSPLMISDISRVDVNLGFHVDRDENRPQRLVTELMVCCADCGSFADPTDGAVELT